VILAVSLQAGALVTAYALRWIMLVASDATGWTEVVFPETRQAVALWTGWGLAQITLAVLLWRMDAANAAAGDERVDGALFTGWAVSTAAAAWLVVALTDSII